MDGFALFVVKNYFTKRKVVEIKQRKQTKKSILSKMIKRDLDRIAKEKDIPRKNLKADMIDVLTKELTMDDIRKYYSEVFGVEEFDLIKHELVPEHRILSPEEKEELKEKYGLKTLKELPKIKVSDPAVIAIGGVYKDVIEITRKSPTAGKSKYYRVVVK